MHQLLMTLITLSLIITACSNTDTGEKFLGNWTPSDGTQDPKIIIKKVGENAFSITASETNEMLGKISQNFTAIYEKGNLIGDRIGIVSYLDGKLFIKNKEFKKVE